MALVLITMGVYLSVILLRRLWSGDDLSHALRIRQRWCRLALRILKISVSWEGFWPQNPVMVECNHRSMMDPVVILAHYTCIPVAKAEIARYPVLGRAAEATGIIFLHRTDPNSRRQTREAIGKWFQRGYSILIFPEGTTGGEQLTRPFRKGSFEVALEQDIPILPLLIEYLDHDVAWESGSMHRHFVTTFGKPSIRVNLKIGQQILVKDAMQGMDQVKSWMDGHLERTETPG